MKNFQLHFQPMKMFNILGLLTTYKIICILSKFSRNSFKFLFQTPIKRILCIFDNFFLPN